MSSVRSLTVVGYKSIRELRDFELRDLNVLIGANGAGKSNFIGLFRLLHEMYEQNLQKFVQVQGGPDALLHFGRQVSESLRVNILFEKNMYGCTLIPTNDNRLVLQGESWGLEGSYNEEAITANIPSDFDIEKIRNESQLKSIRDHDVQKFFIPNWRVYHFHDTSDRAKVKQQHASNDTLRLKPDAANLAAYLHMLRQEHEEAYRRIVGTIRLVAPFFDDFVHREGKPEYIELEWTQKGNPDTPFKAHMLSDGTLRFICLATLLLQPIELLPHTVLIDEPELGLHPYAIAVLAGMFKQVAEDRQLIVSTQSVELVNELAPEDVVVVDQEEGASTFRRFTQDELSDWLKEYALGELWKRNVLGGRP